jgi:putative ABC transport system permease protein
VALISLMIRNVLRNRRRSTLTILSIAASFCMLGVVMAMYSMFFLTQTSAGQALRLIVRNRISFTNPLPLSYEGRIRAVPGVREAMAYQWFGGVYKDARDSRNTFARFAVEEDKLFIVHPEYRISAAEKAAFEHDRTACILGRPLMERLGLKVGDRVTIVGDIFPMTAELTIRGIYDAERGNEDLFFHYDYLNESLPVRDRDWVTLYAVMVDRPESVEPVISAVDTMFRNSTNQTKTETEQSFVLDIFSFLGNVKMFLIAVCATLTLTILLVSANTMAMSVRERSSEVGVLKTLGFTRENIVVLIVGESVLIALGGGALGFGLAEVVLMFLRQARAVLISFHALAISPGMMLLGALLAVVVGVAGCVVPAWGTARRGIVESLRIAD